MTAAAASLDPRLNAVRADLADRRLAGKVAAPRYVAGEEARITLGRAAVRRAPENSAALDTYYHYGEPVLVFAHEGGWLWCQSLDDGYVGYIRDRQTAPPARTTHFVATLGSYLYAEPDLRGRVLDVLPRHAAVAVAESGLLTRGTEYARLDSGGFLPLACLAAEAPRSEDIVAAARLYLGCPYLWGGRSFLGLDCSGLVQTAFRDIGVTVLRDTDMQQATIGAAVTAADEAALRRSDLVYMPGHVLIYTGSGNVVHADGGSMTVREEPLSQFMRRTGRAFPDFTIRRPSHPREERHSRA